MLKQSSLGLPMSSPQGTKDMRRTTCKSCKRYFFVHQMLAGKYCSSMCPSTKRTRNLDKIRKKESKRQRRKNRSDLKKKELLSPKPQIVKIRRNGKEFSFRKSVKINLWSEENKARWLKLRYEIFVRDGKKCALCGCSSKEAILHIDHIKPKSKYPELTFEKTNLQVLCEACNMGKSNRYEDDWRESI